LNFKVGVEAFQGSLSRFNTGVGDDGFAGLSVKSFNSYLLSQLSKLDKLVLDHKIKIRKGLFQV
jgi:hypothetical protein